MVKPAWKETPFSSLEVAKKIADAIGLQPTPLRMRGDISYFETKEGVKVARRGSGPVLQLDAPKKVVPKWISYPRYYSGLWIEEPTMQNLHDPRRLMEKKYQVGEYIQDFVLHFSIKGKEEIYYRIDPLTGKIYSMKS